MNDTRGDGARLRRYPKLPVWVVEDHQEVSGRPKPLIPGRRDSNPGSLQRLDQHLTLAAACPPADVVILPFNVRVSSDLNVPSAVKWGQ